MAYRIIYLNDKGTGGGKGDTAYFIHQPFPGGQYGSPPYYLGTNYDCLGRAKGRYREWHATDHSVSPPEHVIVMAYGSLGHDEMQPAGKLNDYRTLAQIQAGCCPPDILLEYLETQGVYF